MTDRLSTEALVIGSGAGGAITAVRLAEAGLDVTVIEEGPWVPFEAAAPYSATEMTLKYRYGGPNAALARPPIVFVEGRCVGGGTEINSGLYHRPRADLIAPWIRRWQIDLQPDELEYYAKAIENEMEVSLVPGRAPAASAAIADGAARLGWRAGEVPRLYRYDGDDDDPAAATKQTMSRTMIPRAVAAGASVVPNCRALRVRRAGSRAVSVDCRVEHGPREIAPLEIEAEHVFVCAGAIETPALLQRSGVRGRVGVGLKAHPMLKMAARFPDALEGHASVPMHQVSEFAPDITLGGSVSRPGYVALSLADDWERNAVDAADWQHIFVYYAAIRTDGAGRVRALPGLRSPIVSYRLTESDVSRVARAGVHLGELLFAAGATKVYPSISGAPALESPRALADLWRRVNRNDVNLVTVHLFSSVGMSERRELAGADSYGRVWGFDNLHVHDASLLPDSPGVNPQGTIMALAARNCAHFLETRT